MPVSVTIRPAEAHELPLVLEALVHRQLADELEHQRQLVLLGRADGDAHRHQPVLCRP